ncbi:MAG TPA: hypothetical protein VG101_07080 [Puia sp.]|jgi:hypothetical protein|nr:hypothetical protein [Puia sp.]
MAVNFADPNCVAITNEKVFWICDDPPPSANRAYLDFSDDTKWFAWVDNDKEKNVTFTAIDHCIEIKRPNGETESSCDCMLQYDTTLIFVELKDRDSGRWLGKARDQLQITIDKYKSNVGLNGYTRFYSYVANRQRPYFNAASPALAEQFEDDTGFVLVIDHFIKIE